MKTVSFVKKICIVLCTCFVLFAFWGCKTEPAASIMSFVFSVSRNSSLSSDVHGTVYEKTKLIVVKLPAVVYDVPAARSALRAEVTCSKGASLITDEETIDYANNPVSIVVAGLNGDTVAYMVRIEKQYDVVQKGTLLFTEYYSGAKYSLKGTNNQYIEITNISSENVELGGVELNLHAWKNGQRIVEHDQSVQLSGTLAPAKSTVIYSKRTSFSSLNGKGMSDELFNSIISLSGQDALTLTSGGIVLDALGPNDGNGNGWNWGNAKRMQRKRTVTQYDGWNEEEWITLLSTNKIADAENAGSLTDDVPKEINDITYFAFEGLAEIVYGIIDTVAKTITVSVKEEYGVVHKPTVSTKGVAVRLSPNETRIISGQTEIDFSNPVELLSFNREGMAATYKVVFEQIKETKYTSINYDFDGRIKTVLDSISTGLSIDMDVEGILTCKDVYGASSAKKCFFLQDKNAGLFFFINDSSLAKLPEDAVVGNRIRAHVTQGKIYYNMPNMS